MDIIISNSGDTPIYDQITRQIKSLILRGSLAEGEALPSMRLLAKELRISVITTKRAYEELERVDPALVVGVRRSQFSCEALVNDRRAVARRYPGLTVDPVTLEEIMVFTVKGERL